MANMNRCESGALFKECRLEIDRGSPIMLCRLEVVEGGRAFPEMGTIFSVTSYKFETILGISISSSTQSVFD
jgi:hypothetical protein